MPDACFAWYHGWCGLTYATSSHKKPYVAAGQVLRLLEPGAPFHLVRSVGIEVPKRHLFSRCRLWR